MKLFAYEFLTGGGCFSWPSAPRPGGSLLAEGAAMIDALTRDLLAVGHDVTVLRDSRLPVTDELQQSRLTIVTVDSQGRERQLIEEAARTADGVLLVAPETDAALETRARWVEQAGGTLLSPHSRWIELAADKEHCAERLEEAGVSTPMAFRRDNADACTWPMISKPVDGCGSSDLQLVRDAEEARVHADRGRRVESVSCGWPVSVAVLCGPHGDVALQPCEQHLNRKLRYYGGRVPVRQNAYDEMTRKAALRAVAALGPTQGYVGVDLVVDAEKADVVDINPRLTTSYVGLSLYYPRLADAMIKIAMGESTPAIDPVASAFQFTATGEVKRVED